MNVTRRLFGTLSGAALMLGMAPRLARAQEASTLVIAVPSDAAGLEPGINKAEPIGSEVILNVFDTLVAWKAPDFSELEGRLASDWTISEDGRSFSFTLREGILFHDGTPFDSAAVKYSIERTVSMNPYVEASLGLIDSIETPSPTEVVFTLSAPYPALLSILAQPQAAIVSPTAAEAVGETFTDNPVGTGPFKFRSHQADTRIVLDAHPDYFRGSPEAGAAHLLDHPGGFDPTAGI